ncbi:MAG: hypothetical protein IPK68_11250 [Bdellovibrionales bacterium]|nr:hypothetical protein [Bdellovibrionales bacterium]
MANSNFGVVDPNILFRSLNSEDILTSNRLSFDYFMLTLDWLYILGKIDLNEKGDVVRCF